MLILKPQTVLYKVNKGMVVDFHRKVKIILVLKSSFLRIFVDLLIEN